MDPVWLLIFLPFAAASGWYAARHGWHYPSGPQKILPTTYYRSLNYLLNEQHDKALDVLIEALEEHEETVEIQLALGSLFRRRGEVERATQVHQNLVARSGLDSKQRLHALFELSQDYYKAGLLDRAENLLVEVTVSSEFAESAYRLLVQIYEQEKEWESAVTAASKLSEASGDDLTGLIAQFLCELSDSSMAAGKYPESETHIKEALRTDPDCTRALILSGRLYAIRGQHRSAIGAWSRISERRPEMVVDVVDLVRSSYEALNVRDGYRQFLESGLEKNDDFRLVLALVELLNDLGETDEARNYLVDWIQKNRTLEPLYRLLETGSSEGVKSPPVDLGLLTQLVSSVAAGKGGYECRQCGFRAKAMHWQCPGCRSWNTTTPRRWVT